MNTAEVIVIGAGVVGAAIAYGLVQKGCKVLVIDGERADFRASRANFGLIWVQSKGDGFPQYQERTLQSAQNWARFAGELTDITQLPLAVEQNGGLVFCRGENEWNARVAINNRLAAQRPDSKSQAQMLDRAELSKLLPNVEMGPEVVGASFSHADGHANPLQLLSCLHTAIIRLGGQLQFQTPVIEINPNAHGFEVKTQKVSFTADNIVLAAGLSTTRLAAPLGINVPLRSQRGQILVTERMDRFLPFPASGLRQTAEGTVMIGATHEDVGLDAGATALAASKLADRAVRTIPALQNASIVRQWSGLRILSPDGVPIYAQSEQYPGAFTASCHSGVTLAAFHADQFAHAVYDGNLSAEFTAFTPGRFDVQKCA